MIRSESRLKRFHNLREGLDPSTIRQDVVLVSGDFVLVI
jgi:hypothetical protein